MLICKVDNRRKEKYIVKTEPPQSRLLYKSDDASATLQWAIDHGMSILVEGTYPLGSSIVGKRNDVKLEAEA